MSKTQTLHEQNSLNTPAEPQSNQSNSQLVSRTQIENSPFHIVSHDDGHFLALGQYRLTDNLPTTDDVHKHLKLNFWDILVNVMIVLIKSINQQTQDNATANNQ